MLRNKSPLAYAFLRMFEKQANMTGAMIIPHLFKIVNNHFSKWNQVLASCFGGIQNFAWHKFLFNLSSCIIKIVLSEEKTRLLSMSDPLLTYSVFRYYQSFWGWYSGPLGLTVRLTRTVMMTQLCLRGCLSWEIRPNMVQTMLNLIHLVEMIHGNCGF